MKLLLLPMLTLCSFAQAADPATPIFPAHSVYGDTTIDITDIQVPTSYGPAITVAAISICMSQQYGQVSLFASDASGAQNVSMTPAMAKNGNVYCATLVATVARALLAEVGITANTIYQRPSPASATTLRIAPAKSRGEDPALKP